ncbi:hypothetical protein P9112_011846 [Eukaryota sp. TZLM1-RC]
MLLNSFKESNPRDPVGPSEGVTHSGALAAVNSLQSQDKIIEVLELADDAARPETPDNSYNCDSNKSDNYFVSYIPLNPLSSFRVFDPKHQCDTVPLGTPGLDMIPLAHDGVGSFNVKVNPLQQGHCLRRPGSVTNHVVGEGSETSKAKLTFISTASSSPSTSFSVPSYPLIGVSKANKVQQLTELFSTETSSPSQLYSIVQSDTLLNAQMNPLFTYFMVKFPAGCFYAMIDIGVTVFCIFLSLAKKTNFQLTPIRQEIHLADSKVIISRFLATGTMSFELGSFADYSLVLVRLSVLDNKNTLILGCDVLKFLGILTPEYLFINLSDKKLKVLDAESELDHCIPPLARFSHTAVGDVNLDDLI